MNTPLPEYECKTHGKHNKTMKFMYEREISSVFCMTCYEDFIKETIGLMKEVPSKGE